MILRMSVQINRDRECAVNGVLSDIEVRFTNGLTPETMAAMLIDSLTKQLRAEVVPEVAKLIADLRKQG